MYCGNDAMFFQITITMYGGYMLFLTKIILVTTLLLYVWYWVKATVVIAKRNIGIALLGLLLPPLPQIYFYLQKFDELSIDERKYFTIYIPIGLIVMLLELFSMFF